jgi:hypothetical protein
MAAWGGCENDWYAILVIHTMHQGQSIGETWFNYIIGQLAVEMTRQAG